MRKYYTIASIAWQKAMVWRLNTLLEMFGYVATMLIAIALWRFAFLHSNQQTIAGYTMQEMTLYLLVAGWLTSSLWFTAQGDRVAHEIKDGELSNYLVKPVRISWYHFIYGSTGKISQFILSSTTFIIALFVFRLYTYLGTTSLNIIGFVLFFALAWLIQWLIFYISALLAFWMEEVWGQLFVVRVLADVAAGTFLPLSLFAPFWQNVFDVLPFKYIVSVPVNVLMGRVEGVELMSLFIGAFTWFIVLFLLMHVVLKRGIKHYSAVGG